MNYAQFGLFILYVISTLFGGVYILNILGGGKDGRLNRYVYLGEALLLGNIVLVGGLLFLSLINLYKAPYLWGVVFLNYLTIFNKKVRFGLRELVSNIHIGIPETALILAASIFIFRNCYFLIDVDSLSTYLFTQKLWLSAGSSLIGNATNDIRIFIPQFDAVPYALGLSIFGQETLFPQLVNLSWRIIVLLLVFGYTSYRFNKYFGLSAVFLVLFNDHFFYSGANQWVIINGAVIAFLFAAAYNFWEAKSQNNSFRFLLAIIFLSQLMANKYQMVFTSFFIGFVGVLIQYKPFGKFREIFRNKKWAITLLLALFFSSLWYFKNLLINGDPVFPMLAGRFGTFGWTRQMSDEFLKVCAGLEPNLVIKYLNYLFIWPGVNAAKYIAIILSFLPLMIVVAAIRNNLDKDSLLELCFWLGLSILAIIGVCLSNHQDPRYYRYPIGIFAFTAVYSINYILSHCFKIRNKIVLGCLILLISLPGYNLVYQESRFFKRPTLKENIGVISDKIHMDYIIEKHMPGMKMIYEELNKNKERLNDAAWGIGEGMNLPSFLLPVRPLVALWLSTTIKWDSYESKDSIVSDLKEYGIKWVMKIKDDELTFVPIEDYAAEAVKYNRYPKRVYYDYGFPQELVEIKY